MATALPDSSIQPVSDSQVQNGAVQSCKCGYTVRKSVLIYETIIGSWTDPLRHGRFIIIVDQRENSLYKAKKEDALLAIPVYQLFGT